MNGITCTDLVEMAALKKRKNCTIQTEHSSRCCGIRELFLPIAASGLHGLFYLRPQIDSLRVFENLKKSKLLYSTLWDNFFMGKFACTCADLFDACSCLTLTAKYWDNLNGYFLWIYNC